MKYAILSAAIFGSAAAKYGVEKNLDKIRSLSSQAHRYGKIGRCQGDCDNDRQCQPGLKCKQRNWGRDKTITGCEGTAIRNWDYCYEPVSSHSTTLRHYTHSAHKYGKIGQCKGDCDSDAQCMKGLLCKQRHRWESKTITGCKGVAKADWDYCYKPVAAHKDSKELTTHGANAHLIASVKKHGFGMCQGDCDNDKQCRGAMKCYHSSRHGVSLKFQTGCEGKTTSYHDYCYMPKATKAPTQKPTQNPTQKPTQKPTNPPTDPAHIDTQKLTTHGWSAHLLAGAKKHGLGMCQGDCDADSQCRGSMVCYHSHKTGNTVTGCEGKTLSAHDYCYQPLKLSDPKRCQEWGCTEWCAYFDQTTEDAGVYKTNGCGEDGMNTCACN